MTNKFSFKYSTNFFSKIVPSLNSININFVSLSCADQFLSMTTNTFVQLFKPSSFPPPKKKLSHDRPNFYLDYFQSSKLLSPPPHPQEKTCTQIPPVIGKITNFFLCSFLLLCQITQSLIFYYYYQVNLIHSYFISFCLFC